MARKTLIIAILWLFVNNIALSAQNYTTQPPPKKMDNPTITAIEGLAPQHSEQAPILERIGLGRGSYKPDISRVYADGAYYMLFQNKENQDVWFKLSEMTLVGIAQLIPLLDNELIVFLDKTPNLGPGQGKTIWRVHTDCAYYEVVTAAGVYDNLPPIIKKIDDTINQHLLPRH